MTEKNAEAAVADLAERLGVLVSVLEQDGRYDHAALVREAIAALDKPAVVGTPWTTPLKGDKCVRPDGKSREAVRVQYTDGSWNRTSEEARPGWWPNLIWYRDEKGRETGISISASSWATWCRAACRIQGGTYTRAEAQS